MGALISLQCSSSSRGQPGNVTWYWSQCVHDGDVNGTAILPETTMMLMNLVLGNTIRAFLFLSLTLPWATTGVRSVVL